MPTVQSKWGVSNPTTPSALNNDTVKQCSFCGRKSACISSADPLKQEKIKNFLWLLDLGNRAQDYFCEQCDEFVDKMWGVKGYLDYVKSNIIQALKVPLEVNNTLLPELALAFKLKHCANVFPQPSTSAGEIPVAPIPTPARGVSMGNNPTEPMGIELGPNVPAIKIKQERAGDAENPKRPAEPGKNTGTCSKRGKTQDRNEENVGGLDELSSNQNLENPEANVPNAASIIVHMESDGQARTLDSVAASSLDQDKSSSAMETEEQGEVEPGAVSNVGSTPVDSSSGTKFADPQIEFAMNIFVQSDQEDEDEPLTNGDTAHHYLMEWKGVRITMLKDLNNGNSLQCGSCLSFTIVLPGNQGPQADWATSDELKHLKFHIEKEHSTANGETTQEKRDEQQLAPASSALDPIPGPSTGCRIAEDSFTTEKKARGRKKRAEKIKTQCKKCGKFITKGRGYMTLHNRVHKEGTSFEEDNDVEEEDDSMNE